MRWRLTADKRQCVNDFARVLERLDEVRCDVSNRLKSRHGVPAAVAPCPGAPDGVRKRGSGPSRRSSVERDKWRREPSRSASWDGPTAGAWFRPLIVRQTHQTLVEVNAAPVARQLEVHFGRRCGFHDALPKGQAYCVADRNIVPRTGRICIMPPILATNPETPSYSDGVP